MSTLEGLAWELAVVAFAGGAFGAAVGALQAFSLAGLLVIVGELFALVARTAGLDAPIDITGGIAFGAVLGPHVAFGGGAAAVAYAAKRGYIERDGGYHPAKHITQGLGSRPDVLVVGGGFGLLGYLVGTISRGIAVPTDPVALGVVLSAVAHRIALGYDVVGAPTRGYLDMTPFERGGGLDVANDAGPGTVEPWLPYQYQWSHVTVLGVVVGILGAVVAYVTGSPFLAFGISTVALAFLCAGVARIPVTHHMALPASTLVVAAAGSGAHNPTAIAIALPLGEAIALGAAGGAVGAIVGELAQRCLYAHADTHLDPPAASIVITSFMIAALAMLGLLPSSAWIPIP